MCVRETVRTQGTGTTADSEEGTSWLGTEVFESDRHTDTHFSLDSLLSAFHLKPFTCINELKGLFVSRQDS